MGGATGNTTAGGGNAAGGSMGGTDPGGDVLVAVATIAPTTAAPAGWEGFSATATFTQEGNTVTLVIEAAGCPDGPHIAHLHANLECGADGEAAGPHWIPNGEVLEDMLCESGTGTYTHSESTDVWSIGGDAETEITRHAYMVHAVSHAEGAGAKAACGSINAQ
jgi:Cu/Zn superoxide dismutase